MTTRVADARREARQFAAEVCAQLASAARATLARLAFPLFFGPLAYAAYGAAVAALTPAAAAAASAAAPAAAHAAAAAARRRVEANLFGALVTWAPVLFSAAACFDPPAGGFAQGARRAWRRAAQRALKARAPRRAALLDRARAAALAGAGAAHATRQRQWLAWWGVWPAARFVLGGALFGALPPTTAAAPAGGGGGGDADRGEARRLCVVLVVWLQWHDGAQRAGTVVLGAGRAALGRAWRLTWLILTGRLFASDDDLAAARAAAADGRSRQGLDRRRRA